MYFNYEQVRVGINKAEPGDWPAVATNGESGAWGVVLATMGRLAYELVSTSPVPAGPHEEMAFIALFKQRIDD